MVGAAELPIFAEGIGKALEMALQAPQGPCPLSRHYFAYRHQPSQTS
jgi:hypothetical protein